MATNFDACVNGDAVNDMSLKELRALKRELSKGKQTLYDCQTVDALITAYHEKGGICLKTREGVLGDGDWILYGDGLKTTIVREVATTCWSSGHTIRKYNQTPKKYQAIIDAYEAGEMVWEDGQLVSRDESETKNKMRRQPVEPIFENGKWTGVRFPGFPG